MIFWGDGRKMERKNQKEEEKSKVNPDDGLNRTYFGNPTIGGAVIVIILIVIVLYSMFK